MLDHTTLTSGHSEESTMNHDHQEYKMAIDLLRCHLGLSYEEACQQLGIDESQTDESQTELPIGLLFDINQK